jgi:hypothetical protein
MLIPLNAKDTARKYPRNAPDTMGQTPVVSKQLLIAALGPAFDKREYVATTTTTTTSTILNVS